MNFIKRIKNLWSHLLEDFLWRKESENPRILVESTLREYSKKQMETRKTLTSLVFHQKNLESKLKKTNSLLQFYEEKLEELVLNSKDEEALSLMSKTESILEEKKFIEQQLGKLNKDVLSAQKLENELKVKMLLAREKMEVLSSRVEAMRLRKKLQGGLSDLSSGIKDWNVDSQVQKLEKEVFKLELESSDLDSTGSLDAGFNEWTLNNSRDQHLQKLKVLKERLLKSEDLKRLDYICT